MAQCNPDCISIDQSVDLIDGINRIGKGFVVQGNMDPGVLFGSKETIEARVMDVVKKARSQGVRHIMNLGHGVLPGEALVGAGRRGESWVTARTIWPWRPDRLLGKGLNL